MTESTGSDLGKPSEVRPILVSDASEEARELQAVLSAQGYSVAAVPLPSLVSRVAAQPPSLIVCDVDADNALETIHGLRDVPGAAAIDIVFLGEPGRTLDRMRDAVLHEGSSFFMRPIDVHAVVRKIQALVGRPHDISATESSRLPSEASPTAPRAPTPTPSMQPTAPPPARRNSEDLPYPSLVTYEPIAGSEPAPPSHWSVPDRSETLGPVQPSLPAPVPLGFGAEPEGKPPFSPQIPQSEMSEELERLLARAEQRVSRVPASSNPPASRMSPEDEVDAVLPADVLAALDEPLDQDEADEDDEELSSSYGTRTGLRNADQSEPASSAEGVGGAALGPMAAGGAAEGGITSSGGSLFPKSSDSMLPESVRPSTDAPTGLAAIGSVDQKLTEPPATPPAVPRPPSWAPDAEPSSDLAGAGTQHGLPPSSRSIPGLLTQTSARGSFRSFPTAPPKGLGAQERSPDGLEIPAALGRGDAVRALARAVQSRYTGALAFEDSAGIRRVVLRDGDLVTAASGVEGESLVAFLAQRGVLDHEVAGKLGRKLAQFGRHAGAALIAHGHLQQDELWPVLRAHAEWIVGRTIGLERGAVSLEKQIPGRLQAEPAVFGGATGAEVLVEIVRRTVTPEAALSVLGGESARLSEGSSAALLSECALSDAEVALISRALDVSVGELLESAGRDFAPVLYALSELGVLRVVRALASEGSASAVRYDPLDDTALRARIAARIALVENADYFALLGVSRRATGYDIRRAYLELRRQFEPSNVLSAATVDLRDQVDTIVEVLDEAYEILHDQLRRDRYRRALEAAPG